MINARFGTIAPLWNNHKICDETNQTFTIHIIKTDGFQYVHRGSMDI